MERRGPSHSGPYSLACTSCFKSKSKCVARPDGDGCERCHRLNKQCRPSDSLRVRGIEKKQNSSARISALENKIDSLISQLQSRNVIDGSNLDLAPTEQHVSDRPPSSHPVSGVEKSPRSPTQTLDTADDDILAQNSDRDDGGQASPVPLGLQDASRDPLIPANSEPSSRYTLFDLSDADAERSLEIFRSCMLCHFPFMDLSVNLTVKKLQRNRPFLFRAIMCVVSPSARKRMAWGREFKKEICETVLGVHEEQPNSPIDKLDLLLALLTYISWGWNHVLNPNHNSVSVLMIHAISLASELRSASPSTKDAKITNLFSMAFTTQSVTTPMPTPTQQDFLEHQRAIQACFVLSSTLSTFTPNTLDTILRWTPEMEASLVALTTNPTTVSTPSDTLLALQVRLQLLAQKATHAKHQQLRDQSPSPAAPSTDLTPFPTLLTLSTLQTQLQDLQRSLPVNLLQTQRERSLILAHVHSTELNLAETTHAVTATLPIMMGPFARTTPGNSTAAAVSERVRGLWQCVRAAQTCTESLLGLEAGREFRGISVLQWVQLMAGIGALERLGRVDLDEVGWDGGAVRGVVDVKGLVGRVVGKFRLEGSRGGWLGGDDGDDDDDVFGGLVGRMRSFCDGFGGDEEESEQVGTSEAREQPWMVPLDGFSRGRDGGNRFEGTSPWLGGQWT